MLRTASLAVFLLAFWLLLSGHYTAWLIGAGVVVSISLAIGGRFFGFADEEGHPVGRFAAGLAYWPWLTLEILKSSIDVARIVLSPKLPVSPQLFRVKIGPHSPVGIATYANSITLTPGTITVAVDREPAGFLVHALTKAGREGVETGEMDRRVTAFEGRAP